ncbi:hypothetical protein E2C01_060090 [Portunus trituberculatus]|uniref:Uncharacterized protein n=1 Tax=Portunus trituberculatus TaxID=210409 RepID=A0A5B7H1A4_PORTR|nr:hypothetical protein [Portunus trituberculatus]
MRQNVRAPNSPHQLRRSLGRRIYPRIAFCKVLCSTDAARAAASYRDTRPAKVLGLLGIDSAAKLPTKAPREGRRREGLRMASKDLLTRVVLSQAPSASTAAASASSVKASRR